MAIFEPTRDLGVKIDDSIIGGECTMWSEAVTSENIWEKILPRIMLFSDTFWGPVKPKYPDWLEYVYGIVKFKDALEGMGYPVEKITSRYCERNPEACFSYVAPTVFEAMTE